MRGLISNKLHNLVYANGHSFIGVCSLRDGWEYSAGEFSIRDSVNIPYGEPGSAPFIPPSDVAHAQRANGEFLVRHEDTRREELHQKRCCLRLFTFARRSCGNGDTISILPCRRGHENTVSKLIPVGAQDNLQLLSQATCATRSN